MLSLAPRRPPPFAVAGCRHGADGPGRGGPEPHQSAPHAVGEGLTVHERVRPDLDRTAWGQFYELRDMSCIDMLFENEPEPTDEIPDNYCLGRCTGIVMINTGL